MADIIDFKSRYRVEPETLKRNARKNRGQEEYIVKKETRRKAQQKISTKKLKTRIKMCAMATTLVFGSVGAYRAIKQYNQPSKEMQTVQQAIDNGKTFEELGISEELVQRIRDVEYRLIDTEGIKELTVNETKELGTKIQEVMEDILKYKVANLCDTEPNLIENEITEHNRHLIVTGKDGEKVVYESSLLGKHKITKDIAYYMDGLNELKYSNQKIEDANFVNKSKLIKDYKNHAEKIEYLAGTELKINEKDDIAYEDDLSKG